MNDTRLNIFVKLYALLGNKKKSKLCQPNLITVLIIVQIIFILCRDPESPSYDMATFAYFALTKPHKKIIVVIMIDAYEKSKTRDNHIFRHAPEQYSRFAHTSLTHSTTREREIKLKNAAKCDKAICT